MKDNSRPIVLTKKYAVRDGGNDRRLCFTLARYYVTPLLNMITMVLILSQRQSIFLATFKMEVQDFMNISDCCFAAFVCGAESSSLASQCVFYEFLKINYLYLN